MIDDLMLTVIVTAGSPVQPRYSAPGKQTREKDKILPSNENEMKLHLTRRCLFTIRNQIKRDP